MAADIAGVQQRIERALFADLFLMLETIGTQIHILETPGIKKSMMLQDFLKTDMRHKIIYSVVLPALSDDYEYRSYKIMRRAQNAHAHVNAGFLFKLDGGGKVTELFRIIYVTLLVQRICNILREGAGEA